MSVIATRGRSSLPAATAVVACILSLIAWIVRPDNQLGVTRPTTFVATAAVALGAIGVLLGAFETERSRRAAPAAIVGTLVAIIAGLGALLLLMTLPYGN